MLQNDSIHADNTPSELWAIVLAGGDGTRLAETTRRLYGQAIPKQFASFGQLRTFLQMTLDRIAPLIPAQRTIVVVAEQYDALARQQLAETPGVEIVFQPRNAGTAPGVLLPLMHVLYRSPNASVAIVPSDHSFSAPAQLRRSLNQAWQVARLSRSGVVLLGAEALEPAEDLGWIVPVASCGEEPTEVRQFVEKPGTELAARLFAEGAPWNTMLAVPDAPSLRRLATRLLPETMCRLEEYARSLGSAHERRILHHVYADMPSADFSRDLVARANDLHVVRLQHSGWSDCGTPERLAAALPRLRRPSGIYPKMVEAVPLSKGRVAR